MIPQTDIVNRQGKDNAQSLAKGSTSPSIIRPKIMPGDKMYRDGFFKDGLPIYIVDNFETHLSHPQTSKKGKIMNTFEDPDHSSFCPCGQNKTMLIQLEKRAGKAS